MIIQIAGTNGAGKSTAMRAIMERGIATEVMEGTTIIGYDVMLADVDSGLVRVVGRYGDTPTGGCDQFSGVSQIHTRVLDGLTHCAHVLWEGGTVRGGLNQTRGPALVRDLEVPYTVVLLTTPYSQCLDGINARRAEGGRGPLQDDSEIQSNYKRAQNYAARMRDAGARVVRASRDEAPDVVLELLRG